MYVRSTRSHDGRSVGRVLTDHVGGARTGPLSRAWHPVRESRCASSLPACGRIWLEDIHVQAVKPGTIRNYASRALEQRATLVPARRMHVLAPEVVS